MIGVILANTGSPSGYTPDEVEAYLSAYLMDKRIRQLPAPLWRKLLHKQILPKRKFASAKKYEFIWTNEGSPLVVTQRALAQKVQTLYDAHMQDNVATTSNVSTASNTHDICVLSGMSYGTDFISDALAQLRSREVDHVVLLPLYPQSAYSPTRAVIDNFKRAQKALGWHPPSTIIDNYHDHPAYIAAMAHAIRSAGFDAAADDKLIFSFHAIPLKDERAGDTYRTQIAESVELIAGELGIDPARITVAFQSVFGPAQSKWTSPLSTDVLASWRGENARVVFACPGFAIDCLETLYDIPYCMVPALEGETAVPVVSHAGSDIQAACNTNGRFVWVPSLNASDEHAAMVKAVIDSALVRA